jgi:hypothetical protein
MAWLGTDGITELPFMVIDADIVDVRAGVFWLPPGSWVQNIMDEKGGGMFISSEPRQGPSDGARVELHHGKATI